MEKYLTHRGMDVWLVDPKGQIIPHTSNSVKDNTISATVSIKRGALYTVNWKCSPNSPPLSAFWEAFVSSTPRSGRNKGDNQFPEGEVIARHFIDEREPRSQALSSIKNRLFPPYKRNGHLEAPRSVLEDARLGFVRLELRRTQGEIAFWENPVHGQPGDHDCTIEADVLDDKNEGKAPYIVFQFNFIDASAAPSTPAKRLQPAEPSTSSPKHASAKRPRVESPSSKSRQTSNTGIIDLEAQLTRPVRPPAPESSSKKTATTSFPEIIDLEAALTPPVLPSGLESSSNHTRLNLTRPVPPSGLESSSNHTRLSPSSDSSDEAPLPPLAQLRRKLEEKSAELKALEKEIAEREALQKEVALKEAKIRSLKRRLGTV